MCKRLCRKTRTKNVYRFALSALRGELLDREREIERERKTATNNKQNLDRYIPLSEVKRAN